MGKILVIRPVTASHFCHSVIIDATYAKEILLFYVFKRQKKKQRKQQHDEENKFTGFLLKWEHL